MKDCFQCTLCATKFNQSISIIMVYKQSIVKGKQTGTFYYLKPDNHNLIMFSVKTTLMCPHD